MYTLQEARNKLEEYIIFLNQIYSQNYPELGVNIVIYNSLTEKHDFGWIFYYQSDDSNSLIGGNGPVIIENTTLNIYQLGTALTTDEYLKMYNENKDKLPILKKDNDGIWNVL